MAKYVPSDTFAFDDTVKKNEAAYLMSYTPLPPHAEADHESANLTEKKIPFAVTLAATFIICGATWFGIAFVLIKVLNH